MTNREYIRTRNLIQKLVKKWKQKLWLNHWNISCEYREKSFPSSKEDKDYDEEGILDSGGDAYECRAYSNSLWQYMDANIVFNIECLSQLTDEGIEKTVIHELCHLFVDEITHKDSTHNNEERVVSTLTQVLTELDKKHVH